ncbi:MAG: hypothetical protein LQ350_004348 [Teloschistes chrysophthalmus]|nr:MAG: hypothetical protein LQ350_004348 [Niorma chrysophthalma]
MDLQWVPPTSRFAPSPSGPSPHRSPHKRQDTSPTFSDPLLSNLSPSSTLEALQASTDVPPASQNAVYESIAAASSSERALAIRAATAGKQLKEWYKEIQAWDWPDSHNGFESLSSDELVSAQEVEAERMQECWGSLPAQMVLDHDRRIEDIRDAMLTLELDDLKIHVRNVHLLSTSNRQFGVEPNSFTEVNSNGNLLDDFTAIVTTTILQALPVISRLEALMGVWDARLAVLRTVPAFTDALAHAQREMAAAWKALEDEMESQNSEHTMGDGGQNMKAELENQIRELGQRLDYMLDWLEGRPDTLPDKWVDDLERLEGDFCDWAVEVEKRAIDRQLKWQRSFDGDVPKEDPANVTPLPSFEEPQEPALSRNVLEQHDGPFASPALVFHPDTSPTQDFYTDGANDDQVSRYSHRPVPLNLQQHRRNQSDAPSELSSTASFPGSATSDYFSNMSSPEIHDASRTEYFEVGSPVEVVTPGLPRSESRTSQETVTRRASQPTQQDYYQTVLSSPSRSRASTVSPEPTIEENGGLVAPFDEYGDNLPDDWVKNGPQADPFPSAFELQTVADAQTPVHEQPHKDAVCHVAADAQASFFTKPRHRFEEVADLSPGNTPVKIIRRKTTEAVSSTATPLAVRTPTTDGELQVVDLPATPQANGHPTETPTKSVKSEADRLPATPKANRTPMASPSKSMDEQLEARISSILTDIPVDIRLSQGLGAGTPRSPAKSTANAMKKTPPARLGRSQTAVPSPNTMMLTPVDQKGPRARNGDSEVKVYHLHQSGQGPPIKLFVRLVGENGERVMVRIGGGWADLAEYLKEYAIHHGRRTVSGGRFDIQGLPHSQSSSPTTTLGSLSNHQTPGSRPDSPTVGYSTRRSNDVRPASRGSDMSRRSWAGDNSPSLGLAGPKTRKAAVSPNKQAWVDGMMEKARSGSGEKQKSTKGPFGDLGIVGGTKRLFMKGKKES